MKRSSTITVLILVLMLVFSIEVSASLQEKFEIINNVPKLLKIEEFSFSIDSYDDEITYSINLKNNTDQTIEAYGIAFVVFDYFNERCTGLTGVSHTKIKSGGSDSGRWSNSDYSAWQGLTGFAFISKMRLEDGTVVRADTKEIASKMSEILGDTVNSEELIKEKQN